jgi:hypothetical protein
MNNIKIATKEIIVDDGTDFYPDFYIECFNETWYNKKFWTEVPKVNVIVKDGKYYNDENDEYTYEKVEHGYYCLHLSRKTYPSNRNDWHTIYFIKKFDNTKLIPNEDIRVFLNDKKIVKLAKKFEMGCVYTVPRFIDEFRYANWYKGKINKNKLIENLLEIIRDLPNENLEDISDHMREYPEKYHYASKLLVFHDDLTIKDLEEYTENNIENIINDKFPRVIDSGSDSDSE